MFLWYNKFTITKGELEKQGDGKDYEVKFSTPYDSIPSVIASLELGQAYDPSLHHIMIHSVTTEGFMIRYKYTGEKIVNKNVNVNYVATN